MKDRKKITLSLFIIIGLMAISYAIFSVTLKVNGTTTIASSWKIEFEAGSCTNTVQKNANRASSGTIQVSGTTATIVSNMVSPGDELVCTVIAKNTGNINAIRKSWDWAINGQNTNAEAYTIELIAPTAQTLVGTIGKETLTVKITYNASVTTNPTAVASFKAIATYEQDL